MPDKPDPQELKSLLAKIMTQKPEPPDRKETQGQGPQGVIETDKILLRDEAGKSRGKISARADGPAGLILSNNEGSAWAWLGINQDGEAFLELKDKKGEISFKVPADAAAPKAPPESLGNQESGLAPGPVPVAPDMQGASQPATAAAATGTSGGGADAGQSPPDWQPAPMDTTVYDRLDELERKNRGGGISRGIFLGLLLVILALQVYVLVRPKPPGNLQVKSLMVRGHNGVIRAWLGEKNGNPVLSLNDPQGKVRAALGIAKDGSPSLFLYDQDHRLRAGLHLWPNGTPKLFLRSHTSLLGKIQQDAKSNADHQQATAVSNLGSKAGTLADPVTGEAQNLSQSRDAATETYFVGSKTSNKYHFPGCRWAKTIRPSHLIIFKSLKDAQDRGYIPCPVCKPPPLSR